MIRRRSRTAIVAVACLVVLGLGLTRATASSVPIWVGGNIDVHNYTGQDAYDFHVQGTIKSTAPPSWHLFALDTPDWTLGPGQPVITSLGGDLWSFSATWSGSTPIQTCNVAHFGLFFDVVCRNVWVDLDGWWTDQAGNRIQVTPTTGGPAVDNAWPILGFEFPTPFSDPPAPGDVFRLQPDAGVDQIPVEIVQMDLTTVRPPGVFDDLDAWIPFLQQLNPRDMGAFNWESIDPIPRVENDGFMDVPVDPLGFGDVLLVRTQATWVTANGVEETHWFFHAHQAHVPEPLTAMGVLIGVSGLAAYIRRRAAPRH